VGRRLGQRPVELAGQGSVLEAGYGYELVMGTVDAKYVRRC